MHQSLDFHIRLAYNYLSQRRKGKYSEASQASILKILETIYETKICVRTLNYHLRKLEDNNEIRRIRRHSKSSYGRILFRTTLVMLKKKATDVLKKYARFLRKQKFNHWFFPSIGMDAPTSKEHADMIMGYLKTTSQ